MDSLNCKFRSEILHLRENNKKTEEKKWIHFISNFENYAQPQIRLVDENFGKPQQQGEGWSNGNDLDKRIQDALKASEETLKRNQEYLLRTNGKNFFLNLFVL